MAKDKVNTEATLLTPSAVLNLFRFDGTNIGLENIMYFYAGTDFNNQPVTFDGIEYTPMPLEITEFEINGQGRLPRPKLTIANANGFVSNLILQNKDLSGSVITRKRVFVKYIDDINFEGGINPWGTADPEAFFSDEVFFINRRLSENKEIVQFELVCPWEIDNVKLPKRPIYALVCSFNYRENFTCGYSGAPIGDKANKTFTSGYGLTLTNKGEWNSITVYQPGDYVYVSSILPQNYGDKFYYVCVQSNISGIKTKPGTGTFAWIADQCPKNLAGCKLRFPSGSLPFGGFPGVARSRLV